MDLQSLRWPTAHSQSIQPENQDINLGFGGTLQPEPHYVKVDNLDQVQREIQRIQKIKAPLPVKEEQKQYERESPVKQPKPSPTKRRKLF